MPNTVTAKQNTLGNEFYILCHYCKESFTASTSAAAHGKLWDHIVEGHR